MTDKSSILLTALELGIVSTKALVMKFSKTDYERNMISELTRDGYLKHIRKKVPKSRRILSYKCITRKGVAYLLVHNPQECEALGIRSLSDVQYGAGTGNLTTIGNTLQRGEISTAFGMMGIRTFRPGQLPEDFNLQSVFIPSGEVGTFFSLSENELNSIRFSTYRGILLTPTKAFVVFFADENGMLLNKAAAKQLTHVINAHLDNIKIDGGIVFFRERKDFAAVLHKNHIPPKDGIRSAYDVKKACAIDAAISPLYGIPLTRDGIALLYRILSDTKYYVHTETEKILARRPDIRRGSGAVFPLILNEKPGYVGIDMDLARLEKLIVQLEVNPSMEFSLFYFAWQDAYYKSLLRDANVTYIPLINQASGKRH